MQKVINCYVRLVIVQLIVQLHKGVHNLYCLLAIAYLYIVHFFGLITLSAPSANLG